MQIIITLLFLTIPFAQQTDSMIEEKSYLPLIEIIDENFEIPQLIKTRRIAALLPHDYYSSNKSYPVLYLQDGQNLFDDFAPFGSWELPKKLAEMAKNGYGDIIVIAIDHAESERIKEFTPSQKTALGIGDGKKYASFLCETLKPYVDNLYRTRQEPEHTGIGGSSMGGLVSIYAAMQHPHTFSKLLIFSPSMWVSPELSKEFIYGTPEFNGRIYLYGGAKEGSDMIVHLEKFHELIKENPHGRNLPVKLSIREDGEHNETAWGVEFPAAVKWLFFSEETR